MKDRKKLLGYVNDLNTSTRLVRPVIIRMALDFRRVVVDYVRKYKSLPDLRLAARLNRKNIDDLKMALVYAYLLARARVRAHLRSESILLDLTATVKSAFRDVNQATLEYLSNRFETKAFAIADGMGEYAELSLRKVLADGFQQQLALPEIMKDFELEFNRLGLAGNNRYNIETIVRTQTQMAFNAGKYNAETEPGIAEVLWGYTYYTVGDSRVREEHELIDNVTLPKDHPFWLNNYPPNGWNCRCQVVPLFERESIVSPPDDYEGPDEGFNFNPGNALSGI